MSVFRYIPDVVSLELCDEKCNGCGMCMEVCPHAVFRIVDGKSQIADRDLCMECGACARNCAVGAISVKAGVGCAGAIINSRLKGSEPTCGCAGDNGGSCCG